MLSLAAYHYPQAIYSAYTWALHSKWTYLQRVTRLKPATFSELEIHLEEEFIPASFGTDETNIIPGNISKLAVRSGGLGISNLTETAQEQYSNSKDTTFLLRLSLLLNLDLDVTSYKMQVAKKKTYCAEKNGKAESLFENHIQNMDKQQKHSFCWAPNTERWLTTLPLIFNGTTLKHEESTDSIYVCYGLLPPGLPGTCDGCYAPYSIKHVLSCCKGAAILHCHNHLVDEWENLCQHAYSHGTVSTKPYIYLLKDCTQQPQANLAKDLEAWGDVAIYNF